MDLKTTNSKQVFKTLANRTIIKIDYKDNYKYWIIWCYEPQLTAYSFTPDESVYKNIIFAFEGDGKLIIKT